MDLVLLALFFLVWLSWDEEERAEEEMGASYTLDSHD